ncbi:hypothetical protein NQ318_000145 [Aromia moschata]|uniref:Uncharacterized protein n=1 Tax=Aromia moschata TaxID=1265417 RepID=A0AAV8XIA8_9CUCU|nr:hypothetical protein NQ318_000145 [Aromia moschata]
MSAASEVNLKQTLRKIEYPLCAKEALIKIEYMVLAPIQNAASLSMFVHVRGGGRETPTRKLSININQSQSVHGGPAKTTSPAARCNRDGGNGARGGLLKWCILAPIYKQDSVAYSNLHLALLNNILEIPRTNPPKAIYAQNLACCISPILGYVNDLKNKHELKLDQILNEDSLQLSLDRLAQAIQVAYSVNFDIRARFSTKK